VAVLVGATGVATGAITDSLMASSAAATVIRGGGTGTIHTDITLTTITRTATTDTADTPTTDTAGTVTTVPGVTDTAIAAGQGISGVEPNAAIGDEERRISNTPLVVRRMPIDRASVAPRDWAIVYL